MLLRATEELGLDLPHSYLVGDALCDIQAAQAAGAQPILVLTGRGSEQAALLEEHGLGHCPVVPDLGRAVDYILQQEEQGVGRPP